MRQIHTIIEKLLSFEIKTFRTSLINDRFSITEMISLNWQEIEKKEFKKTQYELTMLKIFSKVFVKQYTATDPAPSFCVRSQF